MDVTTRVAGTHKVPDRVGERCQKKFQDFLEQFIDTNGEKIYLEEAKQLYNPERNTLFVDFQHLLAFDDELCKVVQEDYYRVLPYLHFAVRNFVTDNVKDVSDKKEFYAAFSNVPSKLRVRELNSAKIGSLLCISGQVIRTHPVHPELVSGIFNCVDCNSIISNVEQQFKYTQPTICTNPLCQNRGRFLLDIDKSKFVDFQKVRIQETQAEIPRGSIPRSVEVVLRGEIVESVQPGDKCDFTGTLIVVPDVSQISSVGQPANSQGDTRRGTEGYETEGVRGLKSLGVRDLTYRLAFLACNVTSSNQFFGGRDVRGEELTAEKIRDNMTEEEWQKIYEMSQDRNLYTNLITSIFPTIHGNEEVKRGVLLMLLGGVGKTTSEGTKLRGDINVCIVGDPSTAKSQVLKRVEEITPRSVYTSGKASSAAGLTAAVVKDEESFEFVIEAGALMLADNGVCCIDEFDKMDYRDQVAIHEAMEQQTISITKAGVKATLNARASILAAANPIGGRYDKKRTLKQNINLTAPIMSRFDLFFVLVDECRETIDYAIARKIVNLHCGIEEAADSPYTVEEVQRYIMFARQFKPKISVESQEFMVSEYRRLRQRDCVSGTKSSFRITVRQLESMVRLSEAMARMHIMDEVQPRHVKEAFRLLSKSIIRVEQGDVDLEDAHQTAPEPVAPEGQNGMVTAEAKQQSVKIKFEEYKRIMGILMHRLHQLEEEAELTSAQSRPTDSESTDADGETMETEDSADPTEIGGSKKSELVEWYLNQISDDIESMDELADWKLKVEKIISRLVDHEHALIAIDQGSTADDPYLVVHPNYNFEE